MDLIIFAISFLVFSGFGSKILKLTGVISRHKEENIFFAVTLGYGLVAYAVFLLGLSGLLYRGYLSIFLVLLLLLSYAEVLDMARYSVRFMIRFFRKMLSRDEPFFSRILLVFVLAAVVGTFITALAPPIGNDSLAYRLAQIRIYAQDHAVGYVPYTRESLWPNLTEMLYTYGMVMGSDILVKLIAWSFGIIATFAVFAATKRLSPWRYAVLPTSVVLLTPLIFNQMRYVYVDISLALFSFALLLAFMTFIKEKSIKWAVLAGIFAGFVFSVKYTAIITAAGMSIVALYGVFTSENKKTIIKGLVIMAVFAFIFSFSWYLRSYLVKGNPVYPYLADLFSGHGWKRGAENIVGSGFSPVALAVMPWRVTMYPGDFGGENIGVFYLLFFPLIFSLKKTKDTVPLFLFSVAYICVWFFVDPYVLRFILPGLLPLAVLVGGGVDSVLRNRHIPGRAVKTVFVSVCVLNSAILVYHVIPFVGVSLGMESRDHFLSTFERTYETARFINNNLPEDADILLVNEIRTYYIKRPYVHLQNLIDEERIDEERVQDKKFPEDLRRYGMEYVLYLEGGTEYSWIDKLMQDGKLIYQDRHRGRDGIIYDFKVLKIGGQVK
jgi:hypothetical protein